MLRCESNKITDITPLKYYKNLTTLDLDDNQIINIETIIHFDKLENFSFTKNPVLENYKNIKLEKIGWIKNNMLSDLKNLIKIERRKRLINLL